MSFPPGVKAWRKILFSLIINYLEKTGYTRTKIAAIITQNAWARRRLLVT